MPAKKILQMKKLADNENRDSARHLPPATVLHLPLDVAEETASAEKIERWLKLADTVLQQKAHAQSA
jgi:hypothetical protein